MKKLLFIITIFLNLNITAKSSTPNIVALVNNEPITLNEFHTRKQLLVVLNNIENLNNSQDKHLSNLAIKSLIDESLLFQYYNKDVSQEEIDNAIKSIEERNKMPSGYLMEYLKNRSVDVNSFIAQIKSELIKMNILSGFAKSVQISAKEIDATILASNKKDAEVSIQLFTSKNKNNSALSQMSNLSKRISKCKNIHESFYNHFAIMEEINNKLSNLSPIQQTIVKDLNVNQASNVFEMDNKFRVILVCSKKILNVSEDENSYVVNFLTNKKISQKASKFFEDLHKKAYIKIMLP